MLFEPISTLSGVGKKRTELYHKLGITDIMSLLYHLPRGYLDFSESTDICSLTTDGTAVIRAVVTKKLPVSYIRKGMTIYKAVLTDYTDDITAVFYNNVYAFNALEVGKAYYLYGKVSGNFTRKEINSPVVITPDENLIRPMYHLVEGLSNKMLHTNIKEALKILGDSNYDFMPSEVLAENKLCTLSYALENIHFPSDSTALEIARKRLAFDELFLLQLGMLSLRGRNRELTGCRMSTADISPYYDSLPFEPTGAQKRAISEIVSDMCREIPMNRLLQGDVGSGKTAVAAGACYFAYSNGCQSALMAPTEILANQHYKTLSDFLSPLGMKICLLTGSLTAKQKSALKEEIADGKYDVVVGTHALIQQSTQFRRLGLVITDEQHRFGVNQRADLAGKGENPHKLVMSATPIPRTLGLIIYGDLDISVLDELPAGRKPIETYAISGKGLRERAYKFIKKQLDEGRQGYIVCPMIEENENDLISVKAYADKLSTGAFRDYSLGLLHGKMTAAEKDTVMRHFKDGDVQLLIATTVVEVGVDVPNANIMVIENSDRFGLSQLHQLRGRVGRGEHQSYCILLTDNPGEECRERLKIMTYTNDGFKISEEDMRLRGCGDFFGSRQHGLPPFRIAVPDSETLALTQKAAREFFGKSDNLKSYKELRNAVNRLFVTDKENILN
ncbi:MAG: ATP-dependent DNA helicase RecG [Ruminococcus sp.]|nr:ATP-dependent DNA helicase RecG [Ruminococcus sp.]